MRNWIAMLMMVLVIGSLAACGDTEEADDNSGSTVNEVNDGESSEDTEAQEEQSADEIPEDPNFDQIITMLKDEGYETEEPGLAFAEDFKAEYAIQIIIDGEDMLPLQIYKMPADSENLEQAHEKGEMTMEFEGQEGQIPVLAVDEYCFFLADGHPDQKEIYDLIENDFKPE